MTRTHKREHITPVLFQLYWLDVRSRSLYNILFHSVLNGTAPMYLSDLIENYIPMRMLPSEPFSLLRLPKRQTAMYGERSFRASAPRHELPNHIKLAANNDIFCEVLENQLIKLAHL